jgi:VIT1/CCC1 family predicted Fe2+/Mn2+ transporter
MIGTDHATRLLDPIDRVSEILFGLIMAVTFVGSISIAMAGTGEVRTVLIAALGCNLAWGFVDAVMYLVATLTERKRNGRLASEVSGTDPEAGRRLLAESMPEHIAAIAGPDEIEGMRRRLIALPKDVPTSLRRDDWLAALGVFLLVVVATFPVVLPFMLFPDLATAMKVARIVTVAMLFAAGFALGRYAGHERPALTGAMMAFVGVVMIVFVMALGG